MDIASEPLLLVAAFVVLAVAILGWRFFHVTVRSLRLFIRSLWPH